MKVLITAITTLILVFAQNSPLLASQHGMEAKGDTEQTMEREKQRAQEMDPEEARMQMQQHRQQEQMMDQGEGAMEQQREMQQMMDGEGDRSMEQQREMTQEQMEQGAEAENGEEKRERKWWRFWE